MKRIGVYIRRLTYLLVGAVDSALSISVPKVIILSYHGICNDQGIWSISLNEFKKQMLYLSSHFDFISLSDVGRYCLGKKTITRPSVVITFDDGYKNILKAKQLIAKLSIRPAVFVLSEPQNVDRVKLESQEQFLQLSEIKLLKKAGWEIGCHGASHVDLTQLNYHDLNSQINLAREKLEKSLGFSINYFSYPWGRYNSHVLKTVKNTNFSLAVTVDDGEINSHINPLLLPRIGVDKSHSFEEFKVLFSPSVIRLRGFIKTVFHLHD